MFLVATLLLLMTPFFSVENVKAAPENDGVIIVDPGADPTPWDIIGPVLLEIRVDEGGEFTNPYGSQMYQGFLFYPYSKQGFGWVTKTKWNENGNISYPVTTSYTPNSTMDANFTETAARFVKAKDGYEFSHWSYTLAGEEIPSGDDFSPRFIQGQEV